MNSADGEEEVRVVKKVVEDIKKRQKVYNAKSKAGCWGVLVGKVHQLQRVTRRLKQNETERKITKNYNFNYNLTARQRTVDALQNRLELVSLAIGGKSWCTSEPGLGLVNFGDPSLFDVLFRELYEAASASARNRVAHDRSVKMWLAGHRTRNISAQRKRKGSVIKEQAAGAGAAPAPDDEPFGRAEAELVEVAQPPGGSDGKVLSPSPDRSLIDVLGFGNAERRSLVDPYHNTGQPGGASSVYSSGVRILLYAVKSFRPELLSFVCFHFGISWRDLDPEHKLMLLWELDEKTDDLVWLRHCRHSNNFHFDVEQQEVQVQHLNQVQDPDRELHTRRIVMEECMRGKRLIRALVDFLEMPTVDADDPTLGQVVQRHDRSNSVLDIVVGKTDDVAFFSSLYENARAAAANNGFIAAEIVRILSPRTRKSSTRIRSFFKNFRTTHFEGGRQLPSRSALDLLYIWAHFGEYSARTELRWDSDVLAAGDEIGRSLALLDLLVGEWGLPLFAMRVGKDFAMTTVFDAACPGPGHRFEDLGVEREPFGAKCDALLLHEEHHQGDRRDSRVEVPDGSRREWSWTQESPSATSAETDEEEADADAEAVDRELRYQRASTAFEAHFSGAMELEDRMYDQAMRFLFGDVQSQHQISTRPANRAERRSNLSQRHVGNQHVTALLEAFLGFLAAQGDDFWQRVAARITDESSHLWHILREEERSGNPRKSAANYLRTCVWGRITEFLSGTRYGLYEFASGDQATALSLSMALLQQRPAAGGFSSSPTSDSESVVYMPRDYGHGHGITVHRQRLEAASQHLRLHELVGQYLVAAIFPETATLASEEEAANSAQTKVEALAGVDAVQMTFTSTTGAPPSSNSKKATTANGIAHLPTSAASNIAHLVQDEEQEEESAGAHDGYETRSRLPSTIPAMPAEEDEEVDAPGDVEVEPHRSYKRFLGLPNVGRELVASAGAAMGTLSRAEPWQAEVSDTLPAVEPALVEAEAIAVLYAFFTKYAKYVPDGMEAIALAIVEGLNENGRGHPACDLGRVERLKLALVGRLPDLRWKTKSDGNGNTNQAEYLLHQLSRLFSPATTFSDESSPLVAAKSSICGEPEHQWELVHFCGAGASASASSSSDSPRRAEVDEDDLLLDAEEDSHMIMMKGSSFSLLRELVFRIFDNLVPGGDLHADAVRRLRRLIANRLLDAHKEIWQEEETRFSVLKQLAARDFEAILQWQYQAVGRYGERVGGGVFGPEVEMEYWKTQGLLEQFESLVDRIQGYVLDNVRLFERVSVPLILTVIEGENPGQQRSMRQDLGAEGVQTSVQALLTSEEAGASAEEHGQRKELELVKTLGDLCGGGCKHHVPPVSVSLKAMP
eukprot:g139.t1